MPSKAHQWLTDRLLAGRGQPPLTLAEERANAVANAAVTPVPAGITESAFPGHEGALLFEPAEPREDVVLFHIHGGGFRSGCAAGTRSIAGPLALRTRARAVAPEYRLAPEHPFPAGLDDCAEAYAAVRAAYPDARIVVAGDSAGAGLAAALLLRLRDAGDPSPLAGVLYSGVFDLRPENYLSGSWAECAGTDAILRTGRGPMMAREYLADHSPEDPQASPALADLTGLPPLFVLVSGSELLRDDSFGLARRAGGCGVETVLEIWPAMHHAWPVCGAILPEALEAFDRVAAFVERVAAGRVVNGPGLADDPGILAQLPS
ncbi:alpha/beta hydrolase fold domain-containing protein [Streptomyces sp. NPDC050546]|uniref:alpha/beta hydrolase fold domain-containing protein n=1 Tax=Streptomyces sp. NPDC050546 TaxID=3365628 RepID=UPI0037A6A483